MLIRNGLVYTENFRFEKMDIEVKDGVIVDMYETSLCCDNEREQASDCVSSEEVVDAGGKWVLPGLTDIHFHGCVSFDTNDATDEALHAMAVYQKNSGVTTICPTTMTLPKDQVEQIVKKAKEYSLHQKADEAAIVGVNLEGPFISKDKVGAQNPLYVTEPDILFMKRLVKETEHFPKLITVAPEVTGAMEFIREMHEDIRISIGHTMTDYETAKEAYKKGAGHLTHMFNAMPGIHHRKPGPIAAARETEGVTCEIICDGIHVDPAAIRLAFSMMGEDKMILISDSCRACGMPDGRYELGGQDIYKHDHAAFLKDGTLAASTSNVYECMIHAIEFGVPKEWAIRAASYNPAKAVGILDRYGSLRPGKTANILIVDPERNYHLDRVICDGK
ncbi:N-acetylglucosamine-6-phosphate deacetylase [Oribacterium sp. WCC10]|uniref:N-acetylglucosamine-6-phosphate deacetylase n=1 Tax=Oribacterium sp. WCC10 TaxID=1855343 RepID=UPI0008F22235|nr:N-acetylglucosamine-6-phosphate deacetylase [Oribacterium sp. WCC10]SFG16411.1 N-acetylglucosamine-6-phosphate deacetylase [Oribacterium sp. WCC10]